MNANNCHERPRERLMLFGRDHLSDVELLALILGGGRALERGLALLNHLGGLSGLEQASARQMCQVAGVGQASATAISAALELGRRVAMLRLPYAETMNGPEDVAHYVRALLGSIPQETFIVMGLDARQRVRMVRSVATGSLSRVIVHPREVFRSVVSAGMHSVILVHNHPSGDAEPSDADVALTQRMVEVGRILGVPVVDHIIVTADASISLSELGLMPDL